MPAKITAENLFNNFVETLAADTVPKQKYASFFEEEKPKSSSSKFSKLFGRQKSVHNILGGSKSADVMLWRNKKISASILSGATAVWGLFEYLDYNLLTLVFYGLALGMVAQFVWSHTSGFLNRGKSPSKVPRLILPDEFFVDIAKSIGHEVNRILGILQDIACEGNVKQFLVVVASLWTAAVVGSWCNFLTVTYIGFVGAHTLPALYEKYEDEVDNFVYTIFEQFQNHYQKLDAGVISKIPKAKKGKKYY